MTNPMIMHKIFKLAISLLLLVGVSIISKAQNCKRVDIKKDPFSNEISKKAYVVINYITWQIIVERHGDKYNLGVHIYEDGYNKTIFPKGEKFQLKLENGKIIEFESNKDYIPVPNGSAGHVYSMTDVFGDVSIDLIKMLSESRITALKFKLHDKDVVVQDIKSKVADKLIEYVKCILSD